MSVLLQGRKPRVLHHKFIYYLKVLQVTERDSLGKETCIKNIAVHAILHSLHSLQFYIHYILCVNNRTVSFATSHQQLLAQIVYSGLYVSSSTLEILPLSGLLLLTHTTVGWSAVRVGVGCGKGRLVSK